MTGILSQAYDRHPVPQAYDRHPAPRHMTGIHLAIHGTLTTANLSDIILRLQIVKNIDLVGGDSDIEHGES